MKNRSSTLVATDNGDGPPEVKVNKRLTTAVVRIRPSAAPGPVHIEIEPPLIQVCSIKVVGDSGIIINKFNEKTKLQMLATQQGKPNKGRERKDPQACYEAAFHYNAKGKYAFPAIAWKCAAVSACTSLKHTLSKTAARQAFHVSGIDGTDMVEIHGTPEMRQDYVKVGRAKTADLRYRPEFKKWHCFLKIRYNAACLSPSQIVNLINLAGFGVGVGEWRPERNGQAGLFHVEIGEPTDQ